MSTSTPRDAKEHVFVRDGHSGMDQHKPGSLLNPTCLEHEARTSFFVRDFWQQTPDVSGATYCYYNAQPGAFVLFHRQGAMNATPLIIGSKTHFSGNATAKPKSNKLRRSPAETVDVYVDGNFVRRMPLRLLTRFSKYAAQQYPRVTESNEASDTARTKATIKPEVGDNKATEDSGKPGASAQSDESLNIEKKVGVIEGAEAEHQTSNNESSEGDNRKVESWNISAAVQKPALTAEARDNVNATQTVQQRRELELALDTLRQAPSIKAVNMCLEWMFMNKNNHGKETPLKPFELPSLETPLYAFIDIYAAVYCLDLRPFPYNLRNAINDRLTPKRPLAFEIQYMYERSPREESIFRRMVTSYFQHRDRCEYTALEIQAIQSYVQSVDADLFNHFTEVEKHRGRRKQQRHRTRILQGWDQLNVTRPNGYKEPIHSTMMAERNCVAATAETNAAERHPKGDSRGVNGCYVPRADI